jgi:DNA modification methylase
VANQATYPDYLTSLLQTWQECERVLKPNGKLVINVPLLPMLKKVVNDHYDRTIYDLQSDIQASILTNTKLYLYDLYVWEKSNPQRKLMFGSYPYPRNFYCQNIVEFLTVYVKAGQPQLIVYVMVEKDTLFWFVPLRD